MRIAFGPFLLARGRRLLARDGEPVYLRTVHSIGYAFECEARELEGGVPDS
ncbi:MAG: hypothetical protein U0X73_07905 [Thermoanaerobaculia bacterium]